MTCRSTRTRLMIISDISQSTLNEVESRLKEYLKYLLIWNYLNRVILLQLTQNHQHNSLKIINDLPLRLFLYIFFTSWRGMSCNVAVRICYLIQKINKFFVTWHKQFVNNHDTSHECVVHDWIYHWQIFH